MPLASLLLLADGRFPDGTHAHSYGLEAAVAAGRVADPDRLAAYVETRLRTVGFTEASAAALAAGGEDLTAIDRELVVRTPSRAARETSRQLGRSLLRTADRVWPGHGIERIDGRAPMQPVVFGAVAAVCGCTPLEAATGLLHGSATTLATAALRLLGMDPFDVAGVLDGLRDTVTTVAEMAITCSDATALPHRSTPVAELDPELQLAQDLRLFGS